MHQVLEEIGNITHVRQIISQFLYDIVTLRLTLAPLTMAILTGRCFSHQRLALHSATDGVDVEAVQCARLQVGDISICDGGDGQLQDPRLSAVGSNGGEVHPVSGHLDGWTGPGDGDLPISNLVELQLCGCRDLLCGQEGVD